MGPLPNRYAYARRCAVNTAYEAAKYLDRQRLARTARHGRMFAVVVTVVGWAVIFVAIGLIEGALD